MTATLTFNSKVEKSLIFEEIKKCLENTGFYMTLDGRTVQVDHIRKCRLNE